MPIYAEALEAFKELLQPLVKEIQDDYWIRTGGGINSEKLYLLALALYLKRLKDSK